MSDQEELEANNEERREDAEPRSEAEMNERPQPTTCCKCAAYQEIISILHAKIAEARRQLQDVPKFNQWSTDHVNNALKALP